MRAPLLLGSLVQIIDSEDPMRSDTTLFVAALLTLGVPPAGDEYFQSTCEFVRGETTWKVIWNLRDESRDQRFDTLKMQAAWKNAAWLLQNPQHPLAILRGGLTVHRALQHTPRFTRAELASVETPDTWLEAGCRNLIGLLRDIPRAAQAARKIIRFAPRHCAGVPLCLPDRDQTRLLKYVETPSKRSQFS